MVEELNSNSQEDLPIRQNLVDTAVGFLLNPNVKQRPDEAKIAFLKQKGLRDPEIAEAFNKAKCEVGTAAVPNEDNQLVNAYPLPPYQTPLSFWFHLKSYSSAFVSFAVAVYVLHRFYKSYIEPWLFGSNSKVSEISTLQQQLIELNNSVTQLTSTVASLEEAVNSQMHHIDRTSVYDVDSFPKSIKDISEELSGVRSLLLNRFSFPPPPPSLGASIEIKKQNGESKTSQKSATIPKWQLSGSGLEKSKVDSKKPADESESKEKSLGNGLESIEDQTLDQQNNLKTDEDKMQDEDSKGTLENQNRTLGCNDGLENSLSAEGKNQHEDSKAVTKKQVRSLDEKTLDLDSAVELHNHLSNSEPTDETNESGSTKSSE